MTTDNLEGSDPDLSATGAAFAGVRFAAHPTELRHEPNRIPWDLWLRGREDRGIAVQD